MNKIAWIYISLFAVFFWSISCSKQANIGNKIYDEHCSNCHQNNGEGLGELIPNLHSSTYFLLPTDSLVCIILQGKNISTNTNQEDGDFAMPAADLTDVELTNLVNYLYKEFSPSEEYFSLSTIKKSRESCN